MKNFLLPNANSFGNVDELKKVAAKIELGKDYKKGGVPLYSDTSKMLVSVSDTHTLITGTTGSRKTRSFVYETVLNISSAKEKQSMIVHDTKGDVPKQTYEYLKNQGYDVYVLNFRDPVASDHYNVFDSITDCMIKNRKKAKRNLREICNQLFEEELKNDKDSYWLSTVTDYFSGLYESLCVFTKYNKKYVNFPNLMNFHRFITAKGNSLNYLMVKSTLQDQNEFGLLDSLSSVMDNASDTKKNLLSMINNPFNIFESISEMTYKSDFSPRDLGVKPVCVFLVTPDESDKYNFIISLIIKQIYGELIDLAAQQQNNSLLVTVNFIIDEFGSLPKIDSFNSMISAARSRNIRFHLIIQTFSQLRQVYTEFGAVNIFNNCEICICLRSNDYELEELLRKSVGKMTLPYSNKEVELIPNGMLRTLDKGQAIILAQGVHNPVMVKLPDISEYKCYNLTNSDCLARKRKNEIPEFDFKKSLSIDKEMISDTQITNRLINEFKKRQDMIESYHDFKYPVMVTANIRYFRREKYDILINDVHYGDEYKMFNAILKITHASEKDVAENIMNLSSERDEILLRCHNEDEFKRAVIALSPLGDISFKVPDSVS